MSPHDFSTYYQDRRVLITGGLGFLGSNLACRLVDLGAHVLLVDSLIPDYGGNLFNVADIRDRVQVNVADVRDESSMDYLVQGAVDVLMVPVGGFFTVDAAGATKVVDQLSPRIVLPMHYKTPVMSPQWQGGPVDPFLEGKKVEKPSSNKLQISKDKLPATTTVYLLGYES